MLTCSKFFFHLVLNQYLCCNNGMKPGDILLFKAETDPFSRLIAWGTNSKYSHVAVCVAPNMALVIESMVWHGIRAIDIRKTPSTRYDVYRIKEHNNYDLDKVISYLVDKLGRHYDYWGVICLGILKVLGKVGLPVKNAANKWQIDRDYFCSELCYEAFDFGGLDIVPKVSEAEITSPGDIAKSRVIEMVGE